MLPHHLPLVVVSVTSQTKNWRSLCSDKLGCAPSQKETEQFFLLAHVMYKAVLGRRYRNEQQKTGQTTVF